MKTNEIGQFPYVKPTNEYSKDVHPRRYIAHTEAGNTKWVNNWKIMGEVDLIDIPENHPFSELLIDLQTAFDCYCADILEVPGEVEGETIKYVYLRGSGWADLGFPFFDDTITNEDPYKTGSGCYALLRGKARDKFIKLSKQDFIPSFEDCFTGDLKKDFVLPKKFDFAH
jgi:hypothetical protein